MFYSDNIVFMDGKFTKGSPERSTRLMSIALIAPTMYTGAGKRIRPGSELYLEIAPEGEVGGGAEKNATTHPDGEIVSWKTAAAVIEEFLGGNKPRIVTDANPVEWIGFLELFGIQTLPFEYLPVGFASLLWAAGINPAIDRHELASQFGIDTNTFRPSHALDNARLITAVYESIKDGIERERRLAS